jgi:deoxyribodipyrimidine photolyase-like uncharacterized protein
MDKNGKFIGNKLSYDTENRLPYNPDVEIPDMISKNNKNKKKQQKYINEGIKYIEEKFNNNIGCLENYKYLAFSGEEANEYLDNFIKTHRSFFVNIKYISAFKKKSDAGTIMFKSGKTAEVSRNSRKAFIEKIEVLGNTNIF